METCTRRNKKCFFIISLPLITAPVDSVKPLLKVLVLLKSFQISNRIHDYLAKN